MTDEELTRESRPIDAGGSRKKALLLVLLSAALVVGGATWYLGFRAEPEPVVEQAANDGPHFEKSSSFVCLSCAAELAVTEIRQRVDDEQQVSEELVIGPLSQRLGGEPLVSKCTHDWYLLDEHYRLAGGSGREQAPNHRALQVFASSEAGAAALAGFAEETGRNPERAWRSLGLWLTHENPRVASRFDAIDPRDPQLETRLRAWLDDNFTVLERSQQSRGRGHTGLLNGSFRSPKRD